MDGQTKGLYIHWELVMWKCAALSVLREKLLTEQGDEVRRRVNGAENRGRGIPDLGDSLSCVTMECQFDLGLEGKWGFNRRSPVWDVAWGAFQVEEKYRENGEAED